MNLILPWVSGNSHYPGTEKRQIPSGILLLVPSPVSSPEEDVLTTSNALLCAPGLCSNVTAMGPQRPFLDTQGHAWCPAIPQKRDGCVYSQEHSISVSLFPSPFPLFLSDVLCPVPPLDRRGHDNGAGCLQNVLWHCPTQAYLQQSNLLSLIKNRSFCFSTCFFSPLGSFCLIQSE